MLNPEYPVFYRKNYFTNGEFLEAIENDMRKQRAENITYNPRFVPRPKIKPKRNRRIPLRDPILKPIT